MSGSYLFFGILIFAATSFTLGLLLVFIGGLTSYRRSEPEKEVPYECGELPVVETRKVKFPVNYYSFALAFLLFDVEAALLIPWAVSFSSKGWQAFLAAAVFLFILIFGLYYAFKSGGLKWE